MKKQPKGNASFTLSSTPRSRWNVLDLLTIIGRDKVPSYLFYDIDMTWATEFQARLLARGHRTTVTALLLKAIGIAQRNHPASRTESLWFGRTVTYNEIVAGFTVEREVDSQPSVFFGEILAPDSKPVEQIAHELRDYAHAAISSVPSLRLQDAFSSFPKFLRRLILWFGKRFPALRLKCQKATFGLTSLGKYGISSVFGPCICTSTFGIGTVEERPAINDGLIEPRRIMTLTYNFDQKAIDESAAARFFQDVCLLMEGGLSLWVDEKSAIAMPTLAPEPELATLT